MDAKPVSASSAECNHLVLPSDTNWIGTIFGGRIMEWIDIAASIVASRHARKVVVTASMDELHFISPVKLGQIVVLKAAVNVTHRSSMEVGVRVEAEDPLTGARSHTSSAYLTFVALDEAGKPAEVPPVLPETSEEKRRYKEGQERRAARIQRRPKR